MTATIAIIAACYGAGLLAARVYNTGHRHSTAMLTWQPPKFGCDDPAEWSKHIGATSFPRVIEGGRHG